MAGYGLLVDTEWCTGCHSCEFACQMEHGYPVGQTGIMLNEIGPFEYAPELWQFSYIPVPTDLCDGCVDRVASGKLPTCVHHCQAKCMEYGPISSLAKKLEEKSKQVLYSL